MMKKRRKTQEEVPPYRMVVEPADDEDRAWLKRVTEEDEAEFGKSALTEEDHIAAEEFYRELGLR